MRQNVERHFTDAEFARSQSELLSQRQEMYLSRNIDNANQLYRIMSTALMNARYQSIFDPTGKSPEFKRSVLAATNASAALFAAGKSEFAETEIWLGEATTIPSTPADESYRNVANWLDAFYLALVCRHRGLADVLCAIPIVELRASSSQSDECFYRWVAALQAFWQQGDVTNAIARVIDVASMPLVSSRAAIQQTLLPQVAILQQLASGAEQPFNVALTDAIERHKAFWSESDRERDSTGFIALGPWAFSCLARDQGLNLEVSSEYIPIGAIERRG